MIVPDDVGITPDKSVVLTLLQNTSYLIDPSAYCATNVIYADPELYPVAHGDYEQACPNSANYFFVLVADPSGLPLSYTIVTNVTHGTVSINSWGMVTYMPVASFEGIDSFAYTATSGGYSSAPAVVTINVSDPVAADAVQVQTCGNTNAGVTVPLSGGDSCNESLTYAIVVNPAHGQISGLSGSGCIYTPTGSGFTGTDSFIYMVTASAGDWATNVVTVTVGDAGITANSQNVLTGTNISVVIALSVGDSDGCVESNLWTSAVTSGPAHGTLTGSGLNLTYTPNARFEGTDSFQYTASDGVWTSSPATVAINVVGAPYLSGQCDLFGGSAALEWTEDSTTSAMLQNGLSGNSVFVVGRSTNPNGPFSLIATNPASASWAYWDNSASPGQTYYYVVALGFTDNHNSRVTYQSTFSNTNRQTGQGADLIAPGSSWYITDWNELTPANINTNLPVLTIYTNPPNMVLPVFTNWVAGPFSDPVNYATKYGYEYAGLTPLPLTPTLPAWSWTNGHTIWAHCMLNLSGYTRQQLSNVVYSTAIDNGYMLFINRTNVSQIYWNSAAYWGSQSTNGQLFSPLPNIVAGTNTVDVIFWGDDDYADYFSMIVTTNTCH